MNSESLLMMFNGEEEQKCANGENEVTPDKVIEDFYRSMQDASASQMVIDEPHNNICCSEPFVEFKDPGNKNANGDIVYSASNTKLDNSKTNYQNFSSDTDNVTFSTNETDKTFNTIVTSESFIPTSLESQNFSSNINITTQNNVNTLDQQVFCVTNANMEASNINSVDAISKLDFTASNVFFTIQNSQDLISGNNNNNTDQSSLLMTPVVPVSDLSLKDRMKLQNIPDNWQIATPEANGTYSQSAEPLVISDQGAYQLWECKKCTALFREKDVCENHISNAHDFSCTLCNEPFEEKDALINHIVQHISEYQVPEISSQSEEISSKKLSRMNVDHSEDDLSVISKKPKLEEKTFSMNKIDIHKSFNTGKVKTLDKKNSAQPVPEKSSKAASTNRKLKNNSMFTCTICKQECDSQMSFHDHMKLKHSDNDKQFHCDICNASFRSKFSLSNHKAYKHSQQKPKVPKKFQCSVCDKRFTTSSELQGHIRNHEELYPFPCDFCEEKCKSGGSLMNHIKLHHPLAREFYCTECPKSFPCKKYLEGHVSEVHESQRKKCQYCTKSYKTTETLLIHIQEVHYREERRSNDCDYCSQSFANERDLRRHMQIHLSTIQSYDVCDYCSETFSNPRGLRRHIEATHANPSSTYDCNWCSRSFSHKENLKIHVKIHHSPMYNESEYD